MTNSPASPTPAGGAGTPPGSAQLVPWTPIDQMNTWAPTAAYAADRNFECFQACLVSILKWSSGIWVSAAYEDQLVHDPSVPQDTSWDQALTLLADNETNGQLVYPTTQAALQWYVQQSIGLFHHPLIPLRYFGTMGERAELHFVVYTGYSPAGVQLMDPNGGVMRTETWAETWGWFAGEGMLEVQRRRKLGNH